MIKIRPIKIRLPEVPYGAICIFPFVFYDGDGHDASHEETHWWQQLELLVLPFYLLYALFYIFGLIRWRNHHEAYYRNPFEVEAYVNELDDGYLDDRTWYGWTRHVGYWFGEHGE